MTQFPAGLPTGMPSLPTPDARYILPQFEERTPYAVSYTHLTLPTIYSV